MKNIDYIFRKDFIPDKCHRADIAYSHKLLFLEITREGVNTTLIASFADQIIFIYLIFYSFVKVAGLFDIFLQLAHDDIDNV